MTDYDQQIQRIKDKLIQAKQADTDLKVFGAESHQYQFNPPATESEVRAFEEAYSVQLPECYRAFVMQVGNGGISFSKAGAGPYYGIYALGENVNDLIYDNIKLYLKNDCLIYPKITTEEWNLILGRLDTDEELSDEEFELENGRVYGGILPIGSQGCSYLHALILNGPHEGKVVNIDMDRRTPFFTFENNFLDWYERWLDEVISGELISEKAGMFGFNKGGTDETLLNTYLDSEDPEERNDCLWGLMNKMRLTKETLERVEELIRSGAENKQTLIRILCKSDYGKARPYLLQLIETDLLHVFQTIFWYAKDKSPEWFPVIEENIHRITDAETFRFCTYLLQESGENYSPLLIPFTKNKEEEIRVQAFYSLGTLKDRKDLVDVFIAGLNDESNRVIHITLQSLWEVKDERFLKHYRMIAEKFQEDENYILTNLEHRLKEYGLTVETIRNERMTNDSSKKKWYEIWK
ncbi:SMI1 / KNR4 family protein [compost metagenome]